MSKTLQFSVFTNLRQASMHYTPAHSKADGSNVSQKLTINAYMNENRRGSSDDKSKAITLTAWGTAADILAWALSDGKEFTAFCDLNVYDAPVYHNNQPVSIEGQALTRKAFGYTIRRFDLGNDAWKHIANEIQGGIRGPQFWVKGSQDALNFKALLDQRMAIAKSGYNSAQHGGQWGFCTDIRAPKYQHGAYKVENKGAVAVTASVGVAPTAETVAASFGATAPATPAPATVGPDNSFVMPQTTAAPVTAPAGV